MPNRDLSTGEIARLLRVSVSTVIEWIESGELPAYYVPNSSYRRVKREEFFAFLERHGIPLDIVCPPRVPIAVLDPRRQDFAFHLRRELMFATTRVEDFEDFISFGAELQSIAPGIILLDLRKNRECGLGALESHVSRIQNLLAQPYPASIIEIVDTPAQREQILSFPVSERPAAVLVKRPESTAVVKCVLKVFWENHANRVLRTAGQTENASV